MATVNIFMDKEELPCQEHRTKKWANTTFNEDIANYSKYIRNSISSRDYREAVMGTFERERPERENPCPVCTVFLAKSGGVKNCPNSNCPNSI